MFSLIFPDPWTRTGGLLSRANITMNRPSSADPPLATLRDEIDAIDDSIHDLLMRRMTLAGRISEAKRAAGVLGALIRPAREARILRRLMERHGGAFPFPVVARIWSEIMSATLVAEGGFTVSVFTVEPSGEGPDFTTLARAHFGAGTPFILTRTESGVLRAVRDGKASIGVVPAPADAMSGEVGVSAEPWWLTLAVGGDGRPMIVARLPWLPSNEHRGGATNALVVAMIAPEPSGDDISFLAIESSDAISRDRIKSTLAETGIDMIGAVVWHDDNGAPGRWQMIEVNGFLGAEDARLGRFAERMGEDVRRIAALGGHPRPPAATGG